MNGTRTSWELRRLQSRTFQMLASFPYTTAMLLTLLDLMRCLSVWLSSSDTKPMKELSGVWAADTKNRGTHWDRGSRAWKRSDVKHRQSA